MDSLPLSLDDLRTLVSLFERHRLNELELRESGVRVRLRSASPKRMARAVEVAPAPEQRLVDSSESAVSPEERGWTSVTAPMTGAFYASSSPDAPPYVAVGDRIDVDDVIGLIEAMKVYSEIRAEIAGTVVDVPVQTGQMVHPGDVLAWIEPD